MFQFPHTDDLIVSLPDLLAEAGLSINELPCRLKTGSVDNRAADLAAAAAIQPICVTRSFARRIEPGNPADPLLRQILPSPDELSSPDDFTRNPLKEQESARQNLLTKYAGRVLILATEACSGSCRFCFRRFRLKNQIKKRLAVSSQQLVEQSEKQLENTACELTATKNSSLIPHLLSALQYIEDNADVREVILSGGDPLMLDNAQLKELFARLRKIPHVQRVRIHSRMPIYYPDRIDGELIEMFKQWSVLSSAPLEKPTDNALPLTTRRSLFFVTHVNHGNEIDSAVGAAFARLRSSGAILLQQGVLLKGVNNSADALCELYEKLINCGVMPYYLHLLDHVEGAAHFLVDDVAAKELIGQIRDRLPGYAVPRLARELPGEKSKRVLG